MNRCQFYPILTGVLCLSLFASALSAQDYEQWQKLYEAGERANEQQDYVTAKKAYMASVKEAEKFGAYSPWLGFSLFALGMLNQQQASYTEAEQHYLRALAVSEQAFGDSEPSLTMTILTTLAKVYQAQAKYDQAEPFYQRLLAYQQKHLGAEHPSVADTLADLGLNTRSQKRYADAEAFYRRSLQIQEKNSAPDQFKLAVTFHNLARVSNLQGKHADAESLATRALELFEEKLGPDHAYVASRSPQVSEVLPSHSAWW